MKGRKERYQSPLRLQIFITELASKQGVFYEWLKGMSILFIIIGFRCTETTFIKGWKMRYQVIYEEEKMGDGGWDKWKLVLIKIISTYLLFTMSPIPTAPPPPISRPIPISISTPLLCRKCETCQKEHDGSFGAGRFCSSRCARTVGGLAHRKKRALERRIKEKQQEESMRSNTMNQAGRIAISSLLNP